MKRAAFIIVIFFIMINENAECSGKGYGFLCYAYSSESNDVGVSHSFGYDFHYEAGYLFNTDLDVVHNFGFFFKGSDPELKFVSYIVLGEMLGAGLGVSFNLGTPCFSPQTEAMMSLFLIKFNFAYRYNIYAGRHNTHEVRFTVGVVDLISLIAYFK
jgi:hypothetical protein